MKFSYLWQILFFCETRSIYRVNSTALEEVAMAVAGLQEMVLEAPGLEELAKEAPSSPLPKMGLCRRRTFHGLDSKLKW